MAASPVLSPGESQGRTSLAGCGPGRRSLAGCGPGRRSLAGCGPGWRSLVGCGPWGRRESDTTERLHFTHFILYYWRRQWQPTPVFLPGESHGQRSLASHGPRGHRESDTTEVTGHACTHTHNKHFVCAFHIYPGKFLNTLFTLSKKQMIVSVLLAFVMGVCTCAKLL